MQQKKFLFVVNPIAGDTDKSTLPDEIRDFGKRHSHEVQSIDTTGKKDEESIREECKSFLPDVIVGCGGDGTVNLVVQIARDLKLTVGIVPLGSANGMATELSIPTRIPDSLDFLVEEENKMKCDMIRINGRDCLHLGDVGLNAALVKHFQKEGSRGWFGYARQVIRQWRTRKTAKFRIRTDSGSKTRKIKGLVLIFANARFYGTGACVNPRGKLNDGKFEIIVLKPHGIIAFLGTTLRAFFGTISESPFAKIISCSRAEVQIKSKLPLQVDGEMIGDTKQIKAEILEGAVEIIGQQRPI